MIVFESGLETVKTCGVLYSNSDAIRKMAIMMMVNMAEANTDMVCDMPEEYTTKDEVEAVFQGLHESALDALEEHIHDLRVNLESALRNLKYTARVSRLDYDEAGKLVDITVNLDVE